MNTAIRLLVAGTVLRLATSFVARPHVHTQHRYRYHAATRYSSLRAVLVNTTDCKYTPYLNDYEIERDLELQRKLFVNELRRSRRIKLETIQNEMTVSTLENRDADMGPLQKQSGLGELWTARLLLVGAAALYGTNFSIVKILGDSMPVGVSSTLRFGMAAMATLPFLLAPAKEDQQISKKDNTWESVVGDMTPSSSTMAATIAGLEVGMWTSIGYVAQAVGLETTDASKSAFICSLAVVIVPILDFCCGKRLLPREIVGAVMAVAGVGFLEGFFDGASDFTLSTGDIASLIQPITFGMGFWRMERAMRLHPESASRLTAAQLMAVFVASALYCAASPFLGTPFPERSQIVGWLTDPVIMGALFWTGVITTALTVYMETVALKTLSAAETTLIFSTEPLWGAACAAVLCGEQFGLGAAIGAVLILSGCVISNLGAKASGSPQKETETEKAGKGDALDSPSLFSAGLAGVSSGIVATLENSTDELEIFEAITNSVSTESAP